MRGERGEGGQGDTHRPQLVHLGVQRVLQFPQLRAVALHLNVKLGAPVVQVALQALDPLQKLIPRLLQVLREGSGRGSRLLAAAPREGA